MNKSFLRNCSATYTMFWQCIVNGWDGGKGFLNQYGTEGQVDGCTI